MLETKQFWKTSEFYLLVLGQIGVFLTQLIEILPPKYGIPLQSLLAIGYIISRGLAKSGVNPNTRLAETLDTMNEVVRKI